MPESTSFSQLMALLLCLVLVSADLFKEKSRWLMAIGVILLGLFAGLARLGWVVALIGIAALEIYRRKAGRVFAWVLGGAALVGVLLLASNSSTFLAEMLGTGNTSSAATVEYRDLLLDRGLEEIKKHPLSGRDAAAVRAALPDLVQGEGIIDFVNAYIFYGLTAGVPGVIAAIAMLMVGAIGMLARRRVLTANRDLLRIGAVAFAMFCFHVFSLYASGFGGSSAIFFFLIAGTASSASAIAYRERAAAARKATPPEQPQHVFSANG